MFVSPRIVLVRDISKGILKLGQSRIVRTLLTHFDQKNISIRDACGELDSSISLIMLDEKK